MKALLLAAGFGTRLRPITNTIPKCLVPINGRPLLDIWLEKLTNAGITSILVNTHYLADAVISYGKMSKFKDNIKFVHEEKLLGTAGTLLKNIEFFNNEEAMLLHGDNYTLENLKHFIDAHKNRPNNCEITMLTFRTDNPLACGIIVKDKNGIVKGYYEKEFNSPGNLANGAIYILSKEALNKIKKEHSNATEFSKDIIPNFIGKIYTYEVKKEFLDIGTKENLNKANKMKKNE
jgi:mannose-1-phosphate guanylyltransferase